MNNKFVIKTKELIIRPEDETKLWDGDWQIFLRGKEDTYIGKASFKGDKQYGAIPLCVELEEKYRNQGYGTEVFKLLVGFAFGVKNIYEVTAVTDRENDKCVYALEKAGFVRRSVEGTTETYSIIKPKTSWMGLYLIIGVIVGLILVVVLGGSWIGMLIGMIVAILFGMVMDSQENKERENIIGKRD